MNDRKRQQAKAARMIVRSLERRYSLNVDKMRNALADCFRAVGEAMVKVADGLKEMFHAIDLGVKLTNDDCEL